MSSVSNEELIQKAIVTTGALASAGKLNPIQSNQFIDYLIDLTQLKGNVRIVRFRRETMDIDKIGVGSRVTVPKTEAQAPQIRRGVTLSAIHLTPKDQMTPFEISDNFPDQCIEGERVEDTITRLMATQTGNDIEELCLNGDTTGHARLESDMVDGGSATNVVKDAFTAQFDGWLRLGDSGNLYDASGSDIGSVIFSRMLNSMPIKFRRVRRDIRFLCSLDHEQLYREKVGSRATPAGDAANQSASPLTPYGVPLIGVPLLEAEPIIVEHIAFSAGGSTESLRYGPIGTTVIIQNTTLGAAPLAPFAETTDYTVDRVAGTITSVATKLMDPGGAGGTFKITYYSAGQILLTNYQNLIMAIGRNISIERQRDIFKGVNQFAITTRVDVEIEEVTALVKGLNIGLN